VNFLGSKSIYILHAKLVQTCSVEAEVYKLWFLVNYWIFWTYCLQLCCYCSFLSECYVMFSLILSWTFIISFFYNCFQLFPWSTVSLPPQGRGKVYVHITLQSPKIILVDYTGFVVVVLFATLVHDNVKSSLSSFFPNLSILRALFCFCVISIFFNISYAWLERIHDRLNYLYFLYQIIFTLYIVTIWKHFVKFNLFNNLLSWVGTFMHLSSIIV